MKFTILIALFSSSQAVQLTREPLLTWAPTPPATIKRNYFVPNFGEDRDITTTKASLAIAEHQYNHTLNTDPTDPPKRNYFVPNFGIDHDIVAT